MEHPGKEQKLRRARLFISSPENLDKNAVSLLLEVAAQVEEKVSFHDSEDLHCLSLNSRLFTCEIRFGSLLGPCNASGPSKKMAKLGAAQQAVEMLSKTNDGSASSSPFSQRQQVVTRTPEAALGSSSPRSPGYWSPDTPQSASNPIGQLQEMIAERGWTPPSYNLINEQGQAHDKKFVMECKMEELVSQGKGRNKKTAKRVSAENMLSLIEEKQRVSKRDTSTDDAASPTFISPRRRMLELEPLSKVPRAGSATRLTKLPGASASRPSFTLTSLLYDSALDEHDGIDLRELNASLFSDQTQSPKQTIKSCETLKKRGRKGDFSIEYHDLPDKGYSGNQLCFVELGTSPKAVCCGSGITKDAAHADAAHNALEYLDVVSI